MTLDVLQVHHYIIYYIYMVPLKDLPKTSLAQDVEILVLHQQPQAAGKRRQSRQASSLPAHWELSLP